MCQFRTSRYTGDDIPPVQPLDTNAKEIFRKTIREESAAFSVCHLGMDL